MEEFKRQQEESDSLHNVVNHIVDNATDQLLDFFFNRRAEKKTAQQVVESIYQAVSFQLLKSDPGEGADTLNPLWMAESEPLACEIDRFARGMIPLRHRPGSQFRAFTDSKRPNIALRPTTEVVASRAPSVSGISVGSRKGRYTGAPPGRNGNRTTKGRKGKPERKDPLQPYEIHEEIDEEEIKMDKVREIELKKMERRKRLERRQQETKRKAEEEAERLKRLQEELRGKPYTFDQDGNVILIHSLKAERMPAISLEPKIKLKNAQSTQEDSNPKETRQKKKANKKSKNYQSKKAKGKDASHFLEKVESEPAIMDVIELQSGVTIRDSSTGQVKVGAEASGDMIHMTRTEYNNMLDSMQRPMTRMVQPSKSDGGEEMDFGKDAKIKKTTEAPEAVNESSPVSPREPDSPTSPTGFENVPGDEDLKDSSPTPALGRPRSGYEAFQDTSASVYSDIGKSSVGGLTAARGGRAGRRRLRGRGKRHFVKPMSRPLRSSEKADEVVDDSEVDNFNQTILHDPQWGKAKGTGNKAMLRPRPLKATGKERAKAVDIQRARLPRDRAGVSTVNRKLPAPIYPANQGHGFVSGYLGSAKKSEKRKSKPKMNELKVTKDPSTIFGSPPGRRKS